MRWAEELPLGNGATWECICRCGNVTYVASWDLVSGHTQSCGCYMRAVNSERMQGGNNPTYRGEGHHWWKGGITDDRRSATYKSWRNGVWERDKYTCQRCGGGVGGSIVAHHLNGFDNYVEWRFDVDNGVTLCDMCHRAFHSAYGSGNNTRAQFLQWVGL